MRGTTHPSSQARSMMEYSMLLIVTGESTSPATQAPSHGAGQTRPVNSGKLFVFQVPIIHGEDGVDVVVVADVTRGRKDRKGIGKDRYTCDRHRSGVFSWSNPDRAKHDSEWVNSGYQLQRLTH